MASDVCKHCTHAACLDVCPTGALFRTEFGTVVVQDDVCNGCGYCVPACPYGVIDQRDGPQATAGLPRSARCATTGSAAAWSRPARRPARPSRSSSATWTSCASGPQRRVESCTRPGSPTPGSTAHDPDDGVGGDGAFFLLLDEPEVYGLPPDPVVTTRDLPADVAPRRDRRRDRCSPAASRRLRRRWTEQRPMTPETASVRGPRPPAGAAGAAARGEAAMVPGAEFTSYYGRPVVKAAPWERRHPGYLFLGGLAGGVLAAGRRRRPDRAAPPWAVRAGSVRWARSSAASPRWCTTSAGPRGSTTCCGSPSRPRR